MFKLLVEVFKSENLLEQAFNTSIGMMENCQKMFDEASSSLSKEGNNHLDIYKMDQEINEYQRDVRRKVVAHMATSTSRDIVFGLTLVSVIIDIERIGDYTKNIMDLAKDHPHKLEYYQFEEGLKRIEVSVKDRFSRLIKAFKESDDLIAHELMKDHKQDNESCDHFLVELLQEDIKIPTNEAVTLALYIRYLKRINAHITNVASGIVNTFINLGFKSDKQD